MSKDEGNVRIKESRDGNQEMVRKVKNIKIESELGNESTWTKVPWVSC